MVIPRPRRCRCSGPRRMIEAARASATSRTTAARRSLRKHAPRCELQPRPCSAQVFRWSPSGPEGLELARQLWWKLFGVAGGMILGPITQGPEAEMSPIFKEFSRWAAAEPSSYRAVAARNLDPARCGAHAGVCPDAGLSRAALSSGLDSRIPSWRAQLAGRGKNREVSRCLELYRMVQSAGHARRCGSGREVAGRLAHRSADRGASLAGRDGDFGGGVRWKSRSVATDTQQSSHGGRASSPVMDRPLLDRRPRPSRADRRSTGGDARPSFVVYLFLA